MMKIKPVVDHLSYSAVRSFCTSPAQFWKSYVLRERYPSNLTMLAGSAWHAGLEEFYRNGPKDYIEKATDVIFDKVGEFSDKDIDKFDKEVELLVSNLHKYPSIATKQGFSDVIERKVSMTPPVEGGLPITGVIDLVDNHGNPVDHKYVGRYTTDGPSKYMVQAWFYYYLTKEVTGKFPGYFQINEFKKIPNRDKSPQFRPIVVMYEKEWIKKIDKWYVEVTQQIMGQKHFIPNPFQFFGGEDWTEYLKP